MYMKVCVGGSFSAMRGGEVGVSGLGSMQRCVLDCFSKLNPLKQSRTDETSESSLTKCVFSSQNASVTAKAEGKSYSGVSDRQVVTVTRPSVIIRNNKQPLQG